MTSRYKIVKRPNHPLAPPSGQLPLHRVVLYGKIGPGPHPCHECGTEVNWSSRRTAKGALIADHLDGNSTNNDPSNLAPACHPCNTRRGHDRRLADVPVITSERGRRAATERVCAHCSKPFLVVTSLLTNKGSTNTGEYCSRLCQNTAQGQAQAAEIKHRTAVAEERIKQMRREGESYAGIATRLDREGIKPLRSAKWSVASVYKIAHR